MQKISILHFQLWHFPLVLMGGILWPNNVNGIWGQTFGFEDATLTNQNALHIRQASTFPVTLPLKWNFGKSWLCIFNFSFLFCSTKLPVHCPFFFLVLQVVDCIINSLFYSRVPVEWEGLGWVYIVAIQFWGKLKIKYGIVELILLAQQIEKQKITGELNFQLFTFVRMECFFVNAYKPSLRMCRTFQY